MIRIFNIKSNNSIRIDDNDSDVILTINDYSEENQFVKITIENFDFMNHSKSCTDCKKLFESFGTYTKDWYIEYLDKTRRLNLEKFSSKFMDNQIKKIISNDFTGTELKLNLDLDTIELLKEELERNLLVENYESCAIIKRKIDDIK